MKRIKSNTNIVDTFDIKEINEIQNQEFYEALLESLSNSGDDKKELGNVLEESLLGGIAGGIAGSVLAPSIMKAICKILGIAENGTLGQLLTSRLVLGALGAQLGMKM